MLERLETDATHVAIPPDIIVPLVMRALATAAKRAQHSQLVDIALNVLRDRPVLADACGGIPTQRDIEDSINVCLRQMRHFLPGGMDVRISFMKPFDGRLSKRHVWTYANDGDRILEAPSTWHRLLARHFLEQIAPPLEGSSRRVRTRDASVASHAACLVRAVLSRNRSRHVGRVRRAINL